MTVIVIGGTITIIIQCVTDFNRTGVHANARVVAVAGSSDITSWSLTLSQARLAVPKVSPSSS